MPSRIVVDHQSFRRYRHLADGAVQAAVTAAAAGGAAAARSQGSPAGYQIQEVINSATSTTARPSRRGYAAIYYLKDWRGIMFEKGTYRKLGRRGSTRGRKDEAGGNRGVKPQRILRRTVPLTRQLLYENLRRVF